MENSIRCQKKCSLQQKKWLEFYGLVRCANHLLKRIGTKKGNKRQTDNSNSGTLHCKNQRLVLKVTAKTKKKQKINKLKKNSLFKFDNENFAIKTWMSTKINTRFSKKKNLRNMF